MIFKEKPEGFNPKFKVITCFIQVEMKFLLLLRQDSETEGNKWGIIGGKMELGENPIRTLIRELKEEAALNFQENQFKYFTTIFVRYPDFDFEKEIWSATLASKPNITLDFLENKDYKWVLPQEALSEKLLLYESDCIKMFYQLGDISGKSNEMLKDRT